jgi:hypothetical protein
MIYKNIISSRTSLTLLFFIPLLIYVLIRAYSLSFTHDESLSFTIVEANTTWTDTANNHILNTILMSISNTLFGNSEFALRLPNVLSFLLYLIGCCYILKSAKNNWIFLLGISFLLLNPFLIEFFSLARGYGLSIGLMLISILFLIKSAYNYPNYAIFLKDFIYTVLFAALAVYANLALINFLISVIIIFTIKFVVFRIKNEKNIKQTIGFLSVLLLSFIPVLLAVKRLLLLKELNQLYFGAPNFIASISSIVDASIYFTAYTSWLVSIINILIILSLTIAPILLIIKKAYDATLSIIIMLIFILTGGFFLEYFIFEAKLPLERTGLFYVPIFALFIYHFFIFLTAAFKINQQAYNIIISCLIAALFANFLAGANFTYTKTWRYDAYTKDVMKIIKQHTASNTNPAYISNHWLFEPTINYYIKRWQLKLNPTDRYGINLSSNFIYRLDDTSQLTDFKLLYSYQDINTNLLINTKN